TTVSRRMSARFANTNNPKRLELPPQGLIAGGDPRSPLRRCLFGCNDGNRMQFVFLMDFD
ncbi:MAG: hypothetical protein II862_04895, partial [Bacteroidales bacterium]|nr:hypothetical protein [Bacteroidales bacterium]